MQIADKVFVVTGGGNGMGREVVLQLLARGARVAAVDLNEAGLAETVALAKAAEGRLTTHALNVGDRAAVLALPDAVIAAHGQVDGLFNVAGIIQPFVKIGELDFDVIERVLTVNFWGVVNMSKAFLPHLLARPASALLNVSSMGGFLPVPGQAAYGASKAAVKLFTEALYAESQGTPLAVTVIFPGGVGTNITANSGVDASKLEAAAASGGKAPKTTTPQDAGRQIIDAMERGAFRATIGADARFMDRFARLSPRRATLLIANQMKSLLG
ncbi:MAG: short-chain dehydrogenase [Micrococcales bacterium 70-64]|nr:SDR family oxidoreductase [Leifsonia sp.]ODU63861.1 MAG: short-chain dehydrogenase [Leifsonia sp. SCN 70-46]OJX85552.1 MAG: short-chain dehydrogenase [Micrococcales bacterium 70-64]